MRHPNVPEALDGWAILHRMFRFDRRRWDALDGERRAAIEREAHGALAALARDADADLGLAQLLGHKGELMLTHYARSFDALGEVANRPEVRAVVNRAEKVLAHRPCLCFCSRAHPADQGICELLDAVITGRHSSDLLGEIDLWMCAPCAASRAANEFVS